MCPVAWHQGWDALCVVVMYAEIGTEGSVLPVMWHLLLGSPTRVEMQHGEVEIRTGGSVCPVEEQLILERLGCWRTLKSERGRNVQLLPG